MSGKTIKLFIKSDDLKTATLTDNNLCAHLGELRSLKVLEKENKISGACIYLLLDMQDEIKKIYTGQTVDAIGRFADHKRKKDWANFFIIFNGPTLNQLHLDYIEKHLCDKIAENSLEIECDNRQKPKKSHLLDESDENDAKNILDSIIFMLRHLNILNLSNLKNVNLTKRKEVFYLPLKDKNSDKTAKLIKEDGQYILLEGSYLEIRPTPSFEGGVGHRKQQEYIKKGYLVEKDGVLISTRNLPFKSASAPADMVRLNSTNGRIGWKLKDGTTIGELEGR